jgi:putative addiction module component (TIGR02574 family)
MTHAKRHVDELLKLTREERSAAAEALLASLEDEDAEPGADQAWAEEIQRRVAENAPGIPADQVFAEGRARLKRP